MNIALWIVQGLLAAAFFMAGLAKATKPKEELKEKMAWVEDFSQNQLRAIGIVEVLGAVGLILPLLLGVLPILTPLAAAGLALTMFGAMSVHLRRKEMFVPNLVLALLAVFVVYGRYFIDLA